MKTVPLLYFKSVDMAQRNVEGIANYISEALTRAGYHVPHIYWGHPDFEKDLRKAIQATEIEFVFVLAQYSLNAMADGYVIWNHPRFRNTRFFVFLVD